MCFEPNGFLVKRVALPRMMNYYIHTLSDVEVWCAESNGGVAHCCKKRRLIFIVCVRELTERRANENVVLCDDHLNAS